ncbi:hypothetical protein [Abyssalbus ytuae]|uniref:Uncharacterized protein n=1 Tax=Abyssalbus ytuae TaxID=2926907 RepID=A0A9E7CSJ4_9FLAO|nr:hypothetical protein [Abyssalbus ytuae]UOB16376.1 hypothetical protein MQE35_11585 [Abyssalbus ytuae]
MKYIIKFLIIPSIVLFGLISCEDKDKNPLVEYNNEETGAFFRTVDAGGTINRTDIEGSTYTITGELVSPENGADVSAVEIWVEFIDRTFEGDDDESIESTQLLSVSPSTFTTNSNGFPENTFTINMPDALTALGLNVDLVEGGDQFLFQVVINMADGRIFTEANSGDSIKGELFFSSPMVYSALVVCLLDIVPAGDWIIDMQDSYGDGWQTDDSNGGSGMTITLSNGTVFEVGLCNPNVAVDYDCVDNYNSGSTTITIPSGIESAEWYFPGDFYGEISFTITAPSGNVVASYSAGTPAGPIALNLCNE